LPDLRESTLPWTVSEDLSTASPDPGTPSNRTEFIDVTCFFAWVLFGLVLVFLAEVAVLSQRSTQELALAKHLSHTPKSSCFVFFG
jgi:hypothetical protein